MNTTTKTRLDALETASIKVVHKAAEATAKLIGKFCGQKCETKTCV